MIRYLIVSLSLLAVSGPADENNDIFELLDAEILKCETYRTSRQDDIDVLKNRLWELDEGDPGRFSILEQLVTKCNSYDYSQSQKYVSMMLEDAYSLCDPEKINAAKLWNAKVLLSGGLFMPSLEELATVNEEELTKRQVIEWCSLYRSNYYGFAEFVGPSELARTYTELGDRWLEKQTSLLENGSIEWRVAKSLILIHKYKDYEEAMDVLAPVFDIVGIDDRDFAKYATTMAMLYGKEGKTDLQKVMLAKAAICDIRNSVRENTAILQLSKLLYEGGEFDKTYLYAKQAFDDANEYNARHRKMALSDVMHILDTERFIQEREMNVKMKVSLVAMTVLSVISIFFLVVVFLLLKRSNRQKEVIGKANMEISTLNGRLTEANRIKDAYILDFIVLCMDYIDKISAFIIMTRKHLKNKTYDELLKSLDPMVAHKERQNLAHTFDKIFLSLFPDFVKNVNALLTDDGKITVKNEDELNNELRIYALMRLGIKDTAQIANLLDCTVNTIYTYRTNIKGRARCRESFENDVMKVSMKTN